MAQGEQSLKEACVALTVTEWTEVRGNQGSPDATEGN